jgi:hypothetical protein
MNLKNELSLIKKIDEVYNMMFERKQTWLLTISQKKFVRKFVY